MGGSDARPRVTVVADGPFPVQWTRQQAVVTVPEHIDHSNADQVRSGASLPKQVPVGLGR